MSDLIDTTEMYLKTIYALQEEGVPALRARIVERLAQSGPTVSETVARLERDGLLHVGTDREITFTEKGLVRAAGVMRRHRLAERMLTDLLGMDVAEVHDEACRWEHAMSESAADLIDSHLGGPATDPFGNPIPHPQRAPQATPAPKEPGLVPLSAMMNEVMESGQAADVVLARLGEHVQTDEVLADLVSAGARPGVHLVIEPLGDDAQLRTVDGLDLFVPEYIQHAVFVSRVKV